MKRAQIYIDGRAYQGEDVERQEVCQPGLSNGWHNGSTGTVDALKFGDEPITIMGEINIRGHLERILTRLRNRTLDAKRIVIELEDYTP